MFVLCPQIFKLYGFSEAGIKISVYPPICIKIPPSQKKFFWTCFGRRRLEYFGSHRTQSEFDIFCIDRHFKNSRLSPRSKLTGSNRSAPFHDRRESGILLLHLDRLFDCDGVCIYLDNKISTLPLFSPVFQHQTENRVLSRYLKIKLCHFASAFSRLAALGSGFIIKRTKKGMKMLP